MINRKINLVLLCLTAFVFMAACASLKDGSGRESLVIQEQGSFAVGGRVVTAPGTFDPIGHGAFNPANQASEGQTLHGDHAYVFY